MVETAEELIAARNKQYEYPDMTKTLGSFKLTVEAGSFTDSEIIVMLGENGMGKTTLIKLLAGKDNPDNEADSISLSVSFKPQTIAPKFPGTVRMLLLKQIKAMFMHPQFQTDVLKPMNLDALMDQEVKTLSGGELQRVAIVLALGVQVRHIQEVCPITLGNHLHRPTFISWTSPLPSWIPSNVSSPQRLSSVSFFMPKRPLSSSSTISSWPPTSPIV